jgi:hypothetical protein
MVGEPTRLIEEFVVAIREKCGIELPWNAISHDGSVAPHRTHDLPARKGAVYVFTLPADATAPAGANRALKVGKAGPNSNARFRYQHYKSGTANSTLAGAIENNSILHRYIGLRETPEDVGAWIKQNTDRDNFYVIGDRRDILAMLEVFLKGHLGPVFEGSLSSNAS